MSPSSHSNLRKCGRGYPPALVCPAEFPTRCRGVVFADSRSPPPPRSIFFLRPSGVGWFRMVPCGRGSMGNTYRTTLHGVKDYYPCRAVLHSGIVGRKPAMKSITFGGVPRWAALGITLLFAAGAHAAINISTQATQNMSCSGHLHRDSAEGVSQRQRCHQLSGGR